MIKPFDVTDDSMREAIPSGSIVLAQTIDQSEWANLLDFGIYVIELNGAYLIRRLYKLPDDRFAVLKDQDNGASQYPLSYSSITQLYKINCIVTPELSKKRPQAVQGHM